MGNKAWGHGRREGYKEGQKKGRKQGGIVGLAFVAITLVARMIFKKK